MLRYSLMPSNQPATPRAHYRFETSLAEKILAPEKLELKRFSSIDLGRETFTFNECMSANRCWNPISPDDKQTYLHLRDQLSGNRGPTRKIETFCFSEAKSIRLSALSTRRRQGGKIAPSR
jgi:hypothetical protein